MLRVLYDGWPLIYNPLGPAALHLLTLLENLRGDVKPIVALPGDPPPWLDEHIETHVHPVEQAKVNRLRWEQRILPRMVKSANAELLHMTSSNPALFTVAPTVVSPTGYPSHDRQTGFIARAREALSLGGMARLRGIFWPADLPKPRLPAPVFTLPPVVPSFLVDTSKISGTQSGGLDLPETFILYHGPYAESDLRRLIAAWSWAAEPLGDFYPVYLPGIDEPAQTRIPQLMQQFNLTGKMIPLPAASPLQLAQLYRECAVLFHPAEVSAWGGSVRYALACGKPVVALETPLTDAMVGQAAYLLPKRDTRAQGAALIAITGEGELADQLSNAARERSASWNSDDFGEMLLAAYRTVLG